LRIRLGNAKGLWVEKIPEVLWAYRCTPQTSIGETPLSPTYGTNAMIQVKVGEPTLQIQIEDFGINDEWLKIELDLLEELQEKAKVREEFIKRRARKRFNSKVKSSSFNEGD